MRDIDIDTISFLREGQNFSKDPRLALAYFWLCGSHPDTFICNDESPNDPQVFKHVKEAIGAPVGQEEAMLLQKCISKHDSGIARLAACASCNERLFEKKYIIIDAGPVQSLHRSFLLTEKQVHDYCQLPRAMAQAHVSVLQHGKSYYHLNPDLVPNLDNVILCSRCIPIHYFTSTVWHLDMTMVDKALYLNSMKPLEVQHY
jgi:hypothetical protein